jgi:hypothetical protein
MALSRDIGERALFSRLKGKEFRRPEPASNQSTSRLWKILWRLRVDELEAQVALRRIERAGPIFEIYSPHIQPERKA